VPLKHQQARESAHPVDMREARARLESLRHFPTADASKDASVDKWVGLLHQAAAILGYLIYAIRTNSFVFARIGVF
jgi:hypothetical protein